MSDEEIQASGGLRGSGPRDDEALRAERERLAALEGEPVVRRWWGYLKLSGPGYLQSAMTLGSGTAAASLFAGAAFGYRLLWVAPVAMFFGVFVLRAIAWVTLSRDERPFEALRLHVHPALAWGWAGASLLASLIWHFPQYALAGATGKDLCAAAGFDVDEIWIALLTLAIAIPVTWSYGGSSRGRRLYETLIKSVVWLVVLCFGLVVLRTGISDLGEFLRGFVPSIPPPLDLPDGGQVSPVVVIVAGLAAAVGINMTFLFPYTLRARGWGREHRSFAHFDLWTGMFVPYALATTLMVVATANTLYPEFASPNLSPLQASRALHAAVGETLGRIVFNVGLYGMALSTITLHMLCSAFVVCEVGRFDPRGPAWRWASLLPIPGVLGALWWKDMAIWVAIPTTAICGLFLPLAYLGYGILLNRRDYLGAEVPRSPGRWIWNLILVVGLSVVTLFLVDYLIRKLA